MIYDLGDIVDLTNDGDEENGSKENDCCKLKC